MKRYLIPGLMVSVLLPFIAMAEENVDAVYLYRSNVMEISAKHLKALRSYVKGDLAIESHVPSHVDALLNLNGMYQDLFPLGEQHPESEALPAIWSDPRGFQYAIQNNRRKIMALKEVDPADMKSMKRAVNEVRMSCGDCHTYFKED